MQCKDQKFAEVKFHRQVDMQVQFKRFNYGLCGIHLIVIVSACM